MPHDDRLEASYIMCLVEALEKHPTAILAFSNIEFISLAGQREIQTYTDLDGVNNRVSRGWRMLQRNGFWWIPYRGVFRAVASDRIGGLRLNLAGEFSADWPWLFHLSLLGEFIRVPEVLYQRIQRTQSLSRTWKHNSLVWLAATLGCCTEIYRSNLSLTEKTMLQILVVGICLRLLKMGVCGLTNQLRQYLTQR